MDKSNMLVIMSDEHHSGAAGFAGDPHVRTPNLDRLAGRGVRFENAYCNSPICVPSRASFATGRYVNETGHWDNATPYTGTPKSWGHRLLDAGHRSVSIGKLHYRDSADCNGFDPEIEPLHVVNGVGDLLGSVREPLPERKGASKMAEQIGPGESSYTAYDRRTAQNAAAWLREAKRGDKPWTLFVSFVCPHFPLIAPKPFYDMYADGDFWPKFYDETDRPTHEYYTLMRYCANYDKYFDADKVRVAMASYYGLCSFLDHNVGVVLDALEETGLNDETRIIFTSDHGEALGQRGLSG